MSQKVATPAEILTADERAEVQQHLERAYAGVFGAAEIEFHLREHVGEGFADYACNVIATSTPRSARVLDVGAGFGSFVVMARNRGFDAIGTEIAPYEVEFSRRRLARLRPSDNPDKVFLGSGIFDPALKDSTFEAITLWNVLEHVDDDRAILRRATELLVPGGAIYVVCPNYAAWRKEAHYQLPWHPFLSRAAAVRRIRRHGKDPRFFETSIFRRTNWGVMREMVRNGLTLYDGFNRTCYPLDARLLTAVHQRPQQVLDFFNPTRASVELAARKSA